MTVKFSGIDNQPNLFIPGAPKCGTTSLASWLGGHPEICMGIMKEPHYYNTDEKFIRVRNRGDYLSLYERCQTPNQYRLDASVWYLHSRDAVPNILKDCPDARFIVCVRNPVDMAFSLHGHFLNRACREHVRSFEKAWELAEERMRGRAITRWATDPRYLAYSHSCRLGSQCERLLQQVDRGRVCFVVFDELVGNQERTLQCVLNFLNLEPDGELVLPMENVRRDIRSVRVQRMIRRVDKRLSKMSVGRRTVKGVVRSLKRMNQTSYSRTMDSAIRRRLTEYFRQEIEVIWEIVGKRYESWLVDV